LQDLVERLIKHAGHHEQARLRRQPVVHLRGLAEPQHRQRVAGEIALEVARDARVDPVAGQRAVEGRREVPQRRRVEREHRDIGARAFQREEGRHERRLREVQQPGGSAVVLHQRHAA